VSCTLAANAEYGYARLVGYNNDIVGHVYFSPDPTNAAMIRVYANITGITQNLGIPHGMHVHEWGSYFSDPLSVGGHYKGPGTGHHGCYPDATRDAGDMGNWNVSADGMIDEVNSFDLLALAGDNSIIGRAVVLHINTDNCTDVSSAGGRIARGVIGVGNPTYFPFAAFGDTVAAFNNSAVNPGSAVNSPIAVAYLWPTMASTANFPNVTGIVHFTASSGGLQVIAEVFGLPTGGVGYGLHVHEFGDLHTMDGNSVGGHYNPLGQSHGVPPSTSRHLGDMGSICSTDGATGARYYAYINTLASTGGVNSIIGRGVVVHGLADNGSTIYGPRVAQGVIGVVVNTTAPPSIPSGVAPSTPDCGVPQTTTTTDASSTATGASSTSASATTGTASTGATATTTATAATTSQPSSTTSSAAAVTFSVVLFVVALLAL
jgi:Cu-Zn family superoxide dismutase